MKNLLSIGLGGFIGSVLRYICSIACSKILISNFPIGTFFVNILGCFLIGLLINSSIINLSNYYLNELLIIGLLGGFTTFSTFGLESYNLIKNGFTAMSIVYIIASIVFGLIAIYIGSKLNGDF